MAKKNKYRLTAVEVATFKKHARALSQELADIRNRLRELVGEYSDLLESADQAGELMDEAVENLSRFV